MKSKTHITGATLGLLLLIILLSADAHAQNYSVKMVSPDTLQNNSRTVSIRVETTHPIDSSSIEWDTFGPDSMFVAHPTVMLIPSDIYHDTTFSASNWYKHSIIGDISMPADTILMYSVSNLHNGMSFVVLVTGIELEDSLGVSHAANELVHEFTIAEPLPFYQGSSLGAHRTIFPDDTITVYFSAKVEETYTQNGKVRTSLGPIVEIEQYQGYSWDSLTQRYQELRKHVESESWLGVDNHTIHVVLDTAATPITDEWMYLKVNAGYLNGDTLTNNIEDPFGIITSYSVVLSAENALQTDTLPNWLLTKTPAGLHTYCYGDTISLEAKDIGDYTFSYWYAPKIASLHLSTSSITTKSISRADRIRGPIEIKAIYSLADDSLQIVSQTNGHIVLIKNNELVTDSLASDTLHKDRGSTYTVIAYPDSGYSFSHWVSDNSELDSSTSVAAYIGKSMSVSELEAEFSSTGTPSVYTLETSYIVVGPDETGLGQVSLLPAPSGTRTDSDPFSTTCGISILDPTKSIYRITKERITINGNSTERDLNELTSAQTQSQVPGGIQYPSTVEYFLTRPVYELVIIKSKGNNLSQYLGYATVYVEIYEDGQYKVITPKVKEVDREEYLIPRGTEVAVTVSDYDPYYLYFADWNVGVPVTDITNRNQKFRMYADYQMTANYDTPFRLEAVYLQYRNPDNSMSYWGGDDEQSYPFVKGGLDPFKYDWEAQGQRLACDYEDVTSHGADAATAQIKLVFTDDLDYGTLWSNGKPNIFMQELWYRIDMCRRYGPAGYKKKMTYNIDNDSPPNSTNLYSVNGSQNELVVTLCEDYSSDPMFRYAVPHMVMNFVLNGGSNGLRSTSGEELFTKGTGSISMRIATEGPDEKMELLQWKMIRDMDSYSGKSELFSTMMIYRTKLVEHSNHLLQDQVSAFSDRFPPWDGFWHSQLNKWENCNYWMRGYPNRVAEYIFNLKNEEFVNIDFNLFEDDQGNAWNTINDALGFAVQTALSWVGVPEELQELMDKASKELIKYITTDYDFQDGGRIRTEL